MPENKQVTLSYKELATAIVKHLDIHEGIWMIIMSFGINGLNVNSADRKMLPAALVSITEVGVVRVEAENDLAVDAAKVNPLIVVPDFAQRRDYRIN